MEVKGEKYKMLQAKNWTSLPPIRYDKGGGRREWIRCIGFFITWCLLFNYRAVHSGIFSELRVWPVWNKEVYYWSQGGEHSFNPRPWGDWGKKMANSKLSSSLQKPWVQFPVIKGKERQRIPPQVLMEAALPHTHLDFEFLYFRIVRQ